jgi:23S rRNA pseudouridine955/2504/2580 synthase
VSAVKLMTVAADDADVRIDRWFKRHFPALPQVRLQKLLRTGQVRIDGKRAKAGDRLTSGQEVRVPPLSEAQPGVRQARPISDADAEALQRSVLHKDVDVLAIDKPHGLAVQGGSKTDRHIDGMLETLAFGGERPRLVHRLDRDTSGVLLLARNAKTAERLGAAFRGRDVRKVYWAITVGVPEPRQGIIDLPLGKAGPHGEERVSPDAPDAKKAVTAYTVLETTGKALAFVALWPKTGRTHQLRAHLAAIGTPILGDIKYGGGEGEVGTSLGLARKMHLHARTLTLPHPSGKGTLSVSAPPSQHFRASLKALGFDADRRDDPFAALE